MRTADSPRDFTPKWPVPSFQTQNQATVDGGLFLVLLLVRDWLDRSTRDGPRFLLLLRPQHSLGLPPPLQFRQGVGWHLSIYNPRDRDHGRANRDGRLQPGGGSPASSL